MLEVKLRDKLLWTPFGAHTYQRCCKKIDGSSSSIPHVAGSALGAAAVNQKPRQ